MLRELLLKRSTSCSEWINRVVDCDLAVFVIQPCIDVFTTLLQDLLAKQNGGRRCVNEEVIFRDIDIWVHGGPTIVTEMENPSLNTKPRELARSSSSRWADLPLEIAAQRDRDVTILKVNSRENEKRKELTSFPALEVQLRQLQFSQSGRVCPTWCCRVAQAPCARYSRLGYRGRHR